MDATRSKVGRSVAVCAWCLGTALAGPTAEPPQRPSGATLTVRVTDSAGLLAAGALVALEPIDTAVAAAAAPARGAIAPTIRSVRTDPRGFARFEALTAGRYSIRATSEEGQRAALIVSLTAGRQTQVALQLQPESWQEELDVTADRPGPIGAPPEQVAVQLDSAALATRPATTLGDTLATQPGVASTGHAPGAGRPVVRGLSAERVRVLENGLATGDGSSIRDDHGVSIDPLAAERIDLVRGPWALAYGTQALGAVVNVVTRAVPEQLPSRRVGGSARLDFGQVADERIGALSLSGGDRAVAWQVDASNRATGDLRTPEGRLENSDTQTQRAGAGISLCSPGGFGGLAWQDYSASYGLPSPRRIRIDIDRDRKELSSGIEFPGGPFSSLRLRLARTNYEHHELLADGAFASRLDQRTSEGWLALQQRPSVRWSGRSGVQWTQRSVEASGSEGYLPGNRSRSVAVFAIEELTLGRVKLSTGVRWEQLTTTPDSASLPERRLHGLSAATALQIGLGAGWELSGSASQTTRPPGPEELYTGGPHLATFQFEIGDPRLQPETGRGFEEGVRHSAGRMRVNLELFHNRIDDYIFFYATGDTVQVDREEVPAVVALQRDATFVGFETDLEVDLITAAQRRLTAGLRADAVRGTVAQLPTGENLPRIPPGRVGLSLRWETPWLWARVESVRTDAQQRIAFGETPTERFTSTDLSAGVRLQSGAVSHELQLSVRNMTDTLGRNHVSTLKRFWPLPGREIAVGYRIWF